MFIQSKAFAFITFFLFFQNAIAAPLSNPVGIWITSGNKAHIKVEPCGKNICGTIVWLAQPLDPETGEAALDNNNPDESLTSHPLVGLKIFEMKSESETSWSGTIYNPQDGDNYNSTLKIERDGVALQGCVFFDLLCQTQSWVRYKGK